MKLAGLFALFLLLAMTGLSGPVETSPLRAEEIKFIRIGTGPMGGTYFPVGGSIASVISGPPGSMPCNLGGSCGVPGLIAAAVSTEGSLNNVQEMAKEMLDLALCQSNLAHDAYAGTGLYTGRAVKSIRVIANLFPETVHVVVRRESGIKSIGELKGKRVSVGEENSGTLVTAKVVLQAHGLSLKDVRPFYENLARSADMLPLDKIDAFLMVGRQPISAVAHSAERVPIALVPIAAADADRIVAAQPFFSRTFIPAYTYRGVPATETIGVTAQLLASADMDEDLAYAITRALWDPRNRRALDGAIPSVEHIELRSALAEVAVPLHPGARRFYSENGMSE